MIGSVAPAPDLEEVSKIIDLMDSKEHPDEDVPKKIEIEEEKNALKKKFFESSLQSGITTLYLDPRIPGTVVPEKFMGQSMLVLNYSYKYNIRDFTFDDRFVVATLSFGGFPFRCVVPWEAVCAIGSHGQGVVVGFEEEPDERVVAVLKREPEEEWHGKVYQTKNGKSKLRVIDGDG